MKSLEKQFESLIFNGYKLNKEQAKQCVEIAEGFAVGFLNFVENSQFCLINDKYIDMKTDENVDVKIILKLYNQHLKDNGK